MANALAFPVQSGFNGAGNTVAIVANSNVYQSDLNQYLTYFQIPQTGRTISVELVSGASQTPNSSVDEATLDLETVAGLAPGANITLWVIPALTTQNEIDAYEDILSNGAAHVVSSSFAGCEIINANSGEESVFQQGANQGVAFVASSGDAGSACNAGVNGSGQNLYLYGVQYPASDPNVISVGGTETYPPALLTSTVAWNDTYTTTGAQEATGGGVSTLFALPPFQSGVSGLASYQFRNVPDLAMPATFDALYVNGAWLVEAGTSWGAPAFSAMLTEVYEYCGTSFDNPTDVPYYVFATAGYNAFLDITSGNNGFNLVGRSLLAYYAQPGYNNATGIGVPFGMAFARTLCPNRVPAFRSRTATTFATRSLVSRSISGQIDLTPKVRGLVDEGRRDPTSGTRFQIVLRPGLSIASEEQTVIGALRSAGFAIVKTFANHLVIDASGPNAMVEAFFGTTIDNQAQGRFGHVYMPMSPATIPASIAPYISGLSLDDVATR